MVSWQYIAGFFDGEGSLGNAYLTSNNWRARLHQGSTKPLLEIQKFLEERGIVSHIQTTQSKGTPCGGSKYRANSDMHCLQISTKRKDVFNFLTQLLPYLIVKKVLVQDVLRFLKMYPKLHTSTHRLRSSWARKVQRYCTVSECGRKHYAGGSCRRHYARAAYKERMNHAVSRGMVARNVP